MNAPVPLLKEIFIALIVATVVIVIAITLIITRLLRRKLAVEAEERPAVDSREFQLHAYHSVIQRLKEQETELKRLHQAEGERATTSENLSHAILSNLTSGVVLFNTSGMVWQVNEAAKKLLGYASMFGLHARDLFGRTSCARHGDDTRDAPAALTEAVERTLARGEIFRRVEAEYVTPTGERRILGVTLSPVRAAGGEPLGAACLITDLTEIAELSRQMRLRENQAALGEMSAGIAHEFKNSLATISGYAQMLGGENDPAVVQEFAEKIRSETSSLSRIVGDFLNLARPLELNCEPVPLQAMLEDCARECAVGLELNDVAPGLTIDGDPTALRQAFSNLFRNSAEAMRNGTQPRISVNMEQDGNQLRIRLRDNGPGIAAENISKIFIPFFTTKPEGTGLGLPLVHRIIAQHGGAITVSSNTSGATFTLTLPAPKPARPAAEPR